MFRNVKYGSTLRNISTFSESFFVQYTEPEWPMNHSEKSAYPRSDMDGRLKAFLDSQAASTRRDILAAITLLGKPQPHEIKRYLDSKVEKEIEQECKKGKIDYNDKDRFVKKYNITLRTIHTQMVENTT